MVRNAAPPLSELSDDDLSMRIKAELRAREVGGRLLGRKPQVGRLLRALIRKAAGPMTVDLLVNQVRIVLAAYGEVSYLDNVRLRNKLFSMKDVHMLDEQTASLDVTDPAVAGHWADKAVAAILKAAKPYSIVRFLNEHADAPFDAFGLASLLKFDDRVAHIGRRLYAAADYEAEGPLHIAALVGEALCKARAPMTRSELLTYVKQRRDLIVTQMDHYLPRVSGIVMYTPDIVGLAQLDRHVMLQILKNEHCVLSLLRARDEQTPAHVSDLWLIADDEPNISPLEERAFVRASRKWTAALVDARWSGVFFGFKETA
jgi:hypothetical protein